jgi:hypothetical protein
MNAIGYINGPGHRVEATDGALDRDQSRRWLKEKNVDSPAFPSTDHLNRRIERMG